jgi:hypothetical protein
MVRRWYRNKKGCHGSPFYYAWLVNAPESASSPAAIRLQALAVAQRVVMEEQQRTIQTLQDQLRPVLRRQFGPLTSMMSSRSAMSPDRVRCAL